MYIMRYDVNGNDRHLSCLNSVLLTDIATPLYVTKYILYRNCKKKPCICAYVDRSCDVLVQTSQGLERHAEATIYCRIIGNAALDWLKYLRKSIVEVLKEQGTAEGAVVPLFWQRKAVEEAN